MLGLSLLFYVNNFHGIIFEAKLILWLYFAIITCKNHIDTEHSTNNTHDSKVHGAYMGPIWGRQDPGGPHVGPMNFAIWNYSIHSGVKFYFVETAKISCPSRLAVNELIYLVTFDDGFNMSTWGGFIIQEIMNHCRANAHTKLFLHIENYRSLRHCSPYRR